MDSNSLEYIGQINAGFSANAVMSAGRDAVHVVSSYYTRVSHGARTDVVETSNSATLEPPSEVVIPAKHFLVRPASNVISASADGTQLYVSNVTPTASVSIVDTHSQKFIGEISMDGCVLALPRKTLGFSALCESGRILTIGLDAEGKERSRDLSSAFFDSVNDPVSIEVVKDGDAFWFLSHLGMVYGADFSEAQAAFKQPWSLVAAEDRTKGWRPGGLQLAALDVARRRLYVLMHRGKNGSHKSPAEEIWVFDVDAGKRLARWALAKNRVAPLKSLHVIQASADEAHSGQATVYGLSADARLFMLNGETGKLRRPLQRVGVTAQYFVR